MPRSVRIALIGDHDASVVAHRAIPRALQLAAEQASSALAFDWVATDEIHSGTQLDPYDGLWCVPASPYRSMDGALTAIRFAREEERPFLGTCGGFQHAIVEYARHVLGWADADHAETAAGAARPVVTPLACALVEVADMVWFEPGSRIAACYGQGETREGYHCRYGLNPEVEASLVSGPLRVSGRDAAGEVRAVELDDHPFFIATLFQHERAALEGRVPPLVDAFLRAAAG